MLERAPLATLGRKAIPMSLHDTVVPPLLQVLRLNAKPALPEAQMLADVMSGTAVPDRSPLPSSVDALAKPFTAQQSCCRSRGKTSSSTPRLPKRFCATLVRRSAWDSPGGIRLAG